MSVVFGAIVVVVAEIYVLIRVASAIGVLPAALLLIAVSACGPWLVKRSGLGVCRRAQQRLADGELPGREMLDGLLLLIAGVCITIPGFVLDAVGILLLVPPVRAVARRAVAARFERRIAGGGGGGGRGVGGGGGFGGGGPMGGRRGESVVVAESHDRPGGGRRSLPGRSAGDAP